MAILVPQDFKSCGALPMLKINFFLLTKSIVPQDLKSCGEMEKGINNDRVYQTTSSYLSFSLHPLFVQLKVLVLKRVVHFLVVFADAPF